MTSLAEINGWAVIEITKEQVEEVKRKAEEAKHIGAVLLYTLKNLFGLSDEQIEKEANPSELAMSGKLWAELALHEAILAHKLKNDSELSTAMLFFWKEYGPRKADIPYLQLRRRDLVKAERW